MQVNNLERLKAKHKDFLVRREKLIQETEDKNVSAVYREVMYHLEYTGIPSTIMGFKYYNLNKREILKLKTLLTDNQGLKVCIGPRLYIWFWYYFLTDYIFIVV